MAYLQLADNNPYSMLAANPRENYIFIPAGYKGAAKDMHVREDFFDTLPDAEYMQMMRDLAPFQAQGLSALPIAGAVGAVGGFVKGLVQRRRERVAAGEKKPIFKPGGVVDRLFKGQTKTEAAQLLPQQAAQLPAMDQRSVSIGVEVGQPEQTFFQKYKTPILIGGAVLVAGGIFLATRKR